MDHHACQEYNNLTRRGFIGTAGGLTLAALLPAWLPQVSFAQSASSRDVIVSIFLRGGADGLSLCAPYFEDQYYKDRPTLAIPRPDSSDPHKGVALDSHFALPQTMASLLPAFSAGHLLIVHATGSVDPSHSHFDAQLNMERSEPAQIWQGTGWLGRHLASVAPLNPNSPLRGAALSYAVPVTLAGGSLTLPVPNVANFGLDIPSHDATAIAGFLQADYERVQGQIKATAEDSFAVINLLQKLNFSQYAPAGGVKYPTSNFGKSLEASAALIRGQVGIEAIHVDVGGWDTHVNAGSVNGYLAGHMGDFADSIAAFHADLQNAGVTNATLVVVSEFGRKVQENASRGLDHGHGNVMFVLGNNIHGGQVYTQWPGMAQNELFWGQDLQVTTDYRDILAEIIFKRLQNPNLATVFPDFTPTFHGIAA
jgi:uncharacterized protein (DUF1501 family)